MSYLLDIPEGSGTYGEVDFWLPEFSSQMSETMEARFEAAFRNHVSRVEATHRY